ncbi:RNA-directed DNA polymerase [Vibrio sp. SS-MA-C1-2]|uniref:RNA-directed DNA polymerase n=1 Tax=Vibrio sp. SS-MA-C1-2 TaxID=2908646 RepID=UPI001F18241D|nr:RNA-directed DNA polymerase [Vibrio sp. SS-MA-C1-2]UJF19124.1 RNA-directed DNA polymerase [Vibrio sp. SS-MA-C1-2]
MDNMISLDDLYIAYRKAKQDSFYDKMNHDSIKYAIYEQALEKNLQSLFDRITNKDDNWWSDSKFIGKYLYVPKCIKLDKWGDISQSHFYTSSPMSDWENQYAKSRKKLDAEYRLIIAATVNYQIISALWIIKVGYKFELKLNHSTTYGNKLKKIKSQKSGKYAINLDSLGLFEPYFQNYQKWQQNGINAMKKLLSNKKNVTAITMDLTRFYHNTSPTFILHKTFLKKIDVSLTSEESSFTKKFIDSIEHWYRTTPDFQERQQGALPIGLSASKVISNIVLFEFDNQVNNQFKPAYYGRYVDDIFIVFEQKGNVVNKSAGEALSQIRKKIPSMHFNKERTKLQISFPYTQDSDLFFRTEKQKIFTLSSEHGLELVNQIEETLKANSSEFRLQPEIPKTAISMAKKTHLLSDSSILITDALREADSTSLKRFNFSLLLRCIDTYTLNLNKKAWQKARYEFYKFINKYLLIPQGVFDFYMHLPKVYSVMIRNNDYSEAQAFIYNLKRALTLIQNTTMMNGHNKNKFIKFKYYLKNAHLEAALTSSLTKNNYTETVHLQRNIGIISSELIDKKTVLKKELIDKIRTLLKNSDLGYSPYKETWFKQAQKENTSPYRLNLPHNIIDTLRLTAIQSFLIDAKKVDHNWKAFAFPTRPLTVPQIAESCSLALEKDGKLPTYIMALRGARVWKHNPIGYSQNKDPLINIPNNNSGCIHIALTNFQVTDDQYRNALLRLPDRSIERFEEINSLINKILKEKSEKKVKIDYVVFPECSIPRRWAFNLAKNLSNHNISLICGLEIYQKNNFVVHNASLVSLATNWPGYNSHFTFTQHKCMPAHKEAIELEKAQKKLYKPSLPIETHPIYKHGHHFFGLIICSDLTNPINRVHYQGKVDSLFVLSWNQDIETFSFLIESAAHDIHTNIIHVNNREYGDSRIRTPMRKTYQRDSVRLKGGIQNYFVIAKLDTIPLKQFHRDINNIETETIFKPKPIGFEVSQERGIID